MESTVYKVIWPIIVSVLSVTIGVIGTLLKMLYDRHKEKETEQDGEIKEIKNCLAQFPFNYVMREDYVRAITALDMKMDAMSEKLGDISTNLAKLIGGEEHERNQ